MHATEHNNMCTIYVHSKLCTVMHLKEGSIVEDDQFWNICLLNSLKGSKIERKMVPEGRQHS